MNYHFNLIFFRRFRADKKAKNKSDWPLAQKVYASLLMFFLLKVRLSAHPLEEADNYNLSRNRVEIFPWSLAEWKNTTPLTNWVLQIVLLPYGITLFSNVFHIRQRKREFYYLMELHYSQTQEEHRNKTHRFYYLMELHYSQTQNRPTRSTPPFYYLMELHYSQTSNKMCPL